MKLFPTFDRNWGRFAKVTTVYECKLCPGRRDTYEEFEEHFKIHKADKCKTESQQEGVKDENIGEPTMEEFPLEREANILFRCLACNEILKHKDEHRKLHDRNQRPMVCHLCGKISKSLETYLKHLMLHKEKDMKLDQRCNICDKSFLTAVSLKNHIRTHSDARPYICDSCGKGFKKTSALSRHKLIHLPTKPMICPYCGKGFNNESNLRGHLRIHTGEKPYKCDICDAAFTHNISLKSHKKSVHGIDMWNTQNSGNWVKNTEKTSSDVKQSTASTSYSAMETTKYDVQSVPQGLSAAILETNNQAPLVSRESYDNPIIAHSHLPGVKLPKQEHQLQQYSLPSQMPLPSHQIVIPPYPSSALPHGHASIQHQYIPLRPGPLNMSDAGMSSQSAQDYFEAARRTFTKL